FSDNKLRLVKFPDGQYVPTTLAPISDRIIMSCAADFIEEVGGADGGIDSPWIDFVVADESLTAAASNIIIYENRTRESPEPDWTNPTAFRTPKFVPLPVPLNPVDSSTDFKGHGALVCGDFDGDGRQDFIVARCRFGQCDPLERGQVFLGDGKGGFTHPTTDF